MEEIKTPTLEKIKAIQRESELFGKFLDWLLQRYTVFDRKQVRDSPFADVMGAGDYINKERLLAEFFDIDLDAANKERELLLKSLQEHTDDHYVVIFCEDPDCTYEICDKESFENAKYEVVCETNKCPEEVDY